MSAGVANGHAGRVDKHHELAGDLGLAPCHKVEGDHRLVDRDQGAHQQGGFAGQATLKRHRDRGGREFVVAQVHIAHKAIAGDVFARFQTERNLKLEFFSEDGVTGGATEAQAVGNPRRQAQRRSSKNHGRHLLEIIHNGVRAGQDFTLA